MAINNILSFEDSTLVTGTTSFCEYLVVNINNKNVGIPLFRFTNSIPDIDFLELVKLNFKIDEGVIMDTATSYSGGLATTVNNSSYAFPLFRVDNEIKYDDLFIKTPTIVSNLSSTGEFVAVQVNNQAYGIPLYEFSTVFPFTSTVEMSSVNVTTVFHKPTQNMVSPYTGSTNLNNKIKTYKNLIDRILGQLGYPFINLEICEDSQMVDFIDKAIEFYTKYAGYTEEFLVFSSELYREPGISLDRLFSITPSMREAYANGSVPNWDYDLDYYRKVVGVFSFDQGESTGINTLFTLEQAMAQQTYFSYMLGNAGFDLVTWEVLKGWLDLRTKVLAQTPYIDFNNRTQIMRIIPAPNRGSRYYGCVGCWVEKPICDLVMERWVEHYTLALTKIAIGNIRGKYQNTQLFGGGVLNSNDFLTQGLKDKDELEKELMNGYGEVTPARFFLG